MNSYSPYAAGISGYGYGANTNGFDLYGSGASNPTGAALQNFSANTNNAWNGLRTQTSDLGSLNIPQVNTHPSNLGDATGLGFNLGTGKLVLGGIQAIGNLWAAWQANKNAREQFAYQKDVTNTNLANQIKAYNTTLEDRINSRYFTEGKSTADAQSYIAAHQLSRHPNA